MPMHDLNCTHSNPHFSRMHYQLIADTLALTTDYATLIRELMDMFQRDNHLFDRGRFLAAIGGHKKGYR